MNNKFKGLVLSALFAALTAASCFFIIPLPGGIPIILQDMLAMLSGLILGPVYGSISVAVFLLLGSIGLPVFSGKAGLQIITAGPTGGFLIGYLAGAFAGGLLLSLLLNRKKEHSNTKQYIIISLAALLATVVVFAFGIAGFMRVTHKNFVETLGFVLFPFIPGNTIKLVAMIFLTKRFRKIVQF